jgi:hypothetical protein
MNNGTRKLRPTGIAQIALVLLIAVAVMTFAARGGETAPDLEEYAVYSTVIQSLYLEDSPPPGLALAIEAQTGNGPAGDEIDVPHLTAFLQQDLPSVTRAAVTDFAAKNNTPYTLKRLLKLPVDYQLIPKTEVDAMFADFNRGWSNFYSKYPHAQGIITLSRVGFGPGADTALLYVGNQSDYLAGAGFYVFLIKVNGNWVITGRTMAYIS